MNGEGGSAERTSDRQLLQRLFLERRLFVISLLDILGVPEDELEDATQEVFLVVCQRVRNYEERGELRAWLRSICRRVVWNRRRSRKRRREELVDVVEPEVGPTQHDQLIDQEALAFGCLLLSDLPSQQREVFLSYVVEGERMADIARAANCPLQTAYSRLHSARNRIWAAVRANGARSDIVARDLNNKLSAPRASSSGQCVEVGPEERSVVCIFDAMRVRNQKE